MTTLSTPATFPRREPPAPPRATTLPDPGEMSPLDLHLLDGSYMALLCRDVALTPAQDEHWRDIHTRLHYGGKPETPGQQAVRCLIARDLRRATA